ncbi:MAG: ATP-dependent DNA helicase [Nanoarchaeota archaeon]
MGNSIDQAIKKTSGPCVILAGAGTGKTHTIVEKIKYLINNNIYPPEKIVCLTFSNEAAENLLNRIRRSVSIENEPIIKTFHAFSADIIKKYEGKNFRILDSNEAKIVLYRNFRVTPNNCHKYISSISMAKDHGIKPESLHSFLKNEMKKYEGLEIEKYLESLKFELQTIYPKKETEKKKELIEKIKSLSYVIELKKFVNIWEAYEKIKKIKNYMDYSDLNKEALDFLIKNKETSNNFSYFVVDEFQDTNKMQLDLLKELCPGKNITIVGDMNQSIYRFRGTYSGNYSEFKKIFDVSQNDIFELDMSFRSPNKVLKTAYNLILHNYENKADCLYIQNKENKEGTKIDIFELQNSREESRKIAEIIEEELSNGTQPKEICVLFRSHQQGRLIKKYLESRKIPYSANSSISLLKDESVKKIMDYLNIINKTKKNEKGGESSLWNLFYSLSLEEKDMIKISSIIKDLRNSECISKEIFEKIENSDLESKVKVLINKIKEKIDILLSSADSPVPDLVIKMYRLLGFLSEDIEKSSIQNLNKFHTLAKNHSALYVEDLDSFLHYLETINSLGIEIDSAVKENEGIRLMTLHATKGLEFKIVILTNMAQNRFPITKSQNSTIPLELKPEIEKLELTEIEIEERERINQILEERRLCYVAFTRSKEKLFLTYAKKYSERNFHPSQFLSEINYKDSPDINFTEDLEEKTISEEEKVNIFPTAKNSSLSFFINNNNDLPKEFSFSPSSILLFSDCEKKFEYKYKFNMPEERIIAWEEAALGSFVHLVLEKGVKENLRNLSDFLNLARDLHLNEEWSSISLEESEHLIKVFYERNKSKYNENSRTEQKLKTKIGSFNFIGFADRIDFNKEGLEIVDYKTGKSILTPKQRNWQLGYYIIASSKLGKVKKVTIDMLRHEKPLEFSIEENTAKAIGSDRMHFSITEVQNEIIEEATKITEAFKSGFKSCPIDKNCNFCNEFIYKI